MFSKNHSPVGVWLSLSLSIVVGLSLTWSFLNTSHLEPLGAVATPAALNFQLFLPVMRNGTANQTFISAEGGALQSADGLTTVRIQVGAVTELVKLVYQRSHWQRPVPSFYGEPRLQFALSSQTIEGVNLERLRIKPQSQGKPDPESGLGNVIITTHYPKGIVSQALESRLALARFASEVGRWVFLDSVVDAANQTVTAYTDELGDFALLVRPEPVFGLPKDAIVGQLALHSGTPPAEATIVDNESGAGSFDRYGPPSYWWLRSDSGSYGGYMYFTYNTDNPPGRTNWATWTTPPLTEDGLYTIFGCIPLINADTQEAEYQISSGGNTTSVLVNQLANRGQCINLGQHAYTAGETGQVYLDDRVPESQRSLQVKVGYDAIIWLPPSASWTITQTLIPYDEFWARLGIDPAGGVGGEPVSTARGNFYTQHQDLYVPGSGLDVDFTRAYNSYDTRLGSFGRGTSYTYDRRAIDRGNGEIILTLPNGRAGLYKPDGSGGYERPDSFFGELTREGDTLTLTDPDQTVYTFNLDGALKSVTDSNGNHLQFDYDREGYTLTDAVGRRFRVEFNTDGYITKITDPIGRVYTYEYDGDLLKTFHNATGGSITYTYDDQDQMESITDPNGHTFLTNHYDAEGRVDWQKDASQSTTTFAYEGKVTTIVDNEGRQTIHEFDDDYCLVKETDAIGHSKEYRCDDDHNRVYVKDAGGHETFMEFDEQGNLLSIQDALEQTAEFRYDSSNNLTHARDEAGAETIYEYDPHNNLIHIHDAEDGDVWLTYYGNGLIKTLTDQNGHVTEFTYDGEGNLLTVKDAENYVTRFEHDGVSRRTTMTDANGHTVHFGYDPNDRITTILDPKGKSTTFIYDPVGNLKRVTDRRGYSTDYDYNENDSLIQVTNSLGHFVTFTYDKMYHRTSFTNWRRFTTEYKYDAVYNLEKVIDAKHNATTFGYNADHNLTSITDALEQVTEFKHDELHRVVKVIDALTQVTEYTYDPVGRPVRVLDPKGGVTRYEYDQLGRLKKLTDALTHFTTFDYDLVGNLKSFTNARGNTTHYFYDDVNQLVQLMDPLEHTLRLEYDGVGNVIKLIDPRTNPTEFVYDANDNLEQVRDALNGQVIYTYDEEDNRLSVTDQNYHATQFTYDALSNLKRITLPLGQTTNFDYDENSNLKTVINAKGHATRFTYDELDLLDTRANPLGFVTDYDYDALRRLSKVTDAENHATHYGYDALARLKRVTDALGGITAYDYDPLGNLTAYTDANGHATMFDVDLLGRVLGETNTLGKIWRYDYDAVGNLIRRQDANGAITDYTFDKDDRLTHIAYPTGPGVDFTYDENDNLVGLADSSGAANFAYDALNRLTESKRTAGLPLIKGKAFRYDYDPASNRIGITYPDDGKRVKYEYNANDWLTSVTDPLTGTTTYDYDPVGLPTHVAYPNGTWADYTYDAADRLTRLFNGKPDASSDVISSFDYTLDKVGNRMRTIEKVTRGQVVTWDKQYTYDALYRVTHAVFTPDLNPYQVLTADYAYDPVGNRLSQTTNIADQPNTPALDPAQTMTYAYNEANQLLSASSPLSSTQFAYDANGNRLSMIGSARVISYTYDDENRLIGATTFDVLKPKWQYDSTLDFTYDGLGRRLERGVVDNGVRKVAEFLYDGLGYDLLAQYVDPGDPRTTYYYRDPMQILSRHEIQGQGAGLQYFHHYDGLGDVSAWTNQSGRETQEYMYAPYGRLIDNNGPDNASSKTDPHNNLTWSGKPYDKETELNYFGARDYDSTFGVWLTQDPYRGRIAEPMTLHRYGYVGGNSVNWIDSIGLRVDCPNPLSGAINAMKNFWARFDSLLGGGIDGLIRHERMIHTLEVALNQTSKEIRQTNSGKVNQYASAIVYSTDHKFGRNSCGLVAAAAAVEGSGDIKAVVKEMAKILKNCGASYDPQSGIQPLPYAEALKKTYGEEKVSAHQNWTQCGIYAELVKGNVVIVDFKSTTAGPTVGQGDFAHFARVVGMDLENNTVTIENTLGGNDWTLSWSDFEKSWKYPETDLKEDVLNKFDRTKLEKVTNWAVVIDRSAVKAQNN